MRKLLLAAAVAASIGFVVFVSVDKPADTGEGHGPSTLERPREQPDPTREPPRLERSLAQPKDTGPNDTGPNDTGAGRYGVESDLHLPSR